MGSIPQSWEAAFRRRTVTVGAAFAPLVVDQTLLYGQVTTTSRTSIAQVNINTGQLGMIAGLPPSAAGVGAMAAAGSWVVWQEGDSAYQPADWRVRAWNSRTGAITLLASSAMSNGTFVQGQPPIVVLQGDHAAWAEPMGSTVYQITVVNLATGQRHVLVTGRASSPVYVGGYLLWAQEQADGSTFFRSVNAVTLKSVTLPTALRGPQSVLYLAGSPQYLAWSNQSSSALMVWRTGAPFYTQFLPQIPLPHVQFIQLSGHFALWYSGTADNVLDINSGKGFVGPVSPAGFATLLTGSSAAILETIDGASPSKTDPLPSTVHVSYMAADSAPAIVACSRTGASTGQPTVAS